MYIGIDEVGTFNPVLKNEHIYVSVQASTTKSNKKLKNELEKWKKKNKHLKSGNEIKGSKINNKELNEVAKILIGTENVFITITKLGHDITAADITRYTADYLSKFEAYLNKTLEVGNTKLHQSLLEMRNWNRKLNTQQQTRLMCLSNHLYSSIREHILYVIVKNQPLSLEKIEICIDRDFIKNPRHLSFWKYRLGNAFFSNSKYKPLPILKEWVGKYKSIFTKEGSGKHVIYTNSELQDYILFVDSQKNHLVQYADIVGQIFVRRNDFDMNYEYSNLKKKFMPDQTYIELTGIDPIIY